MLLVIIVIIIIIDRLPCNFLTFIILSYYIRNNMLTNWPLQFYASFTLSIPYCSSPFRVCASHRSLKCNAANTTSPVSSACSLCVGGIFLKIWGTCCTVMMGLELCYPSPAVLSPQAPGQNHIHYQVIGIQQGKRDFSQQATTLKTYGWMWKSGRPMRAFTLRAHKHRNVF